MQSEKSPKTSLFFGLMLVISAVYFWFWANNYIGGQNTLVLSLAVAFGLFMAFNIGGNDVANSFGTSVGAGTLTIRQALLVAAIFEVSGAMIAGGSVTSTIRKGIVDLSVVSVDPMQFVYVMMGALFAAAFWLLFASKRGLPVSTTHSIIGGIVGGSIALSWVITNGDDPFSTVKWGKIGQIAASWIISPLLGGLIAYAIFKVIKVQVLDYNAWAQVKLAEVKAKKKELKLASKERFAALSEDEKAEYNNKLARDALLASDGDFDANDFESEYYRELKQLNEKRDELRSHKALQSYVPIIAAMGAMIISAMLIFKGLKKVDLELSSLQNGLVLLMIGAAVWMAVAILVKVMKTKNLEKSTLVLFSWMQVFTAAGFAFSHGSNDIANAIGPFAAILDVLRTGMMGSSAAIPKIAMFTFGIALVAGLWFIGKEVIKTVGTHLTKLHPASGFAAELAAAMVVLLASTLGIPVSSTHILIGSVLGVGIVNADANWKLMKPIGMAWIITLPAAGIMSAIAFLVMNAYL